jgi:diguanylate cyclase (GGDEF)-like protein
MTKRIVMKKHQKPEINIPSKQSAFNLLRYFFISSIAIILIFTAILSFVLVFRQKHNMIEHSIFMTEEATHQLNHQLLNSSTLSVIEMNGYKTIDKKKIKHDQMEKIIKDFLNTYSDILKIKIYDRNGYTIYSTDKEYEGQINTSDNFRSALKNSVVSEFLKKSKNKQMDPNEQGKLYKLDMLEVYVPITIYIDHIGHQKHRNETVIGVFEIYRDMGLMIHEVEMESFRISFLVLVFMAVLFIFLQIILRRANVIINKQNEEIDRNNINLEEAHKRIKSAMSEVVQHESFHIRYSGSDLVKCWEFKNCKQTDCPSHESSNLRCWQVSGTFCGGNVQGVFAKKFGDCRKCEVYKYAFKNKINNIGESFNNMMALLQSKHAELKELNEKLQDVANVDHLMQIGNRRYFQERVESIHQLALRYQRYYSIIVCDIDNFKKYNDTYGHQKGDYVLISVANLFKKLLRKTDEIFRWGGEEIIVILPEQSLTDALKVAESLRAGVEKLSIKHKMSTPQVVTVSFGVASYFPGKNTEIDWEKVIKDADDALYRAKEGDKNTVYSA